MTPDVLYFELSGSNHLIFMSGANQGMCVSTVSGGEGGGDYVGPAEVGTIWNLVVSVLPESAASFEVDDGSHSLLNSGGVLDASQGVRILSYPLHTSEERIWMVVEYGYMSPSPPIPQPPSCTALYERCDDIAPCCKGACANDDDQDYFTCSCLTDHSSCSAASPSECCSGICSLRESEDGGGYLCFPPSP